MKDFNDDDYRDKAIELDGEGNPAEAFSRYRNKPADYPEGTPYFYDWYMKQQKAWRDWRQSVIDGEARVENAAAAKKWREANPEVVAQQADRCRENVKRWKETNREKVKAQLQRARLRKKTETA